MSEVKVQGPRIQDCNSKAAAVVTMEGLPILSQPAKNTKVYWPKNSKEGTEYAS